jgi:prepilin-type N-terminal cleavage/methylation domain-containing protein
MMRNRKGFTLIELMIVVAIIGILAAIAIPMYTANVNKAKLQEATDTIGAIKDEVCNYVSDTGHMPDWPVGSGNTNLAEAGIFGGLGVQVPESVGGTATAPGGRKWIYRIVDGTAGGGTYDVRATGQAAADIGTVLSSQWVECRGTYDAANGVFTDWQWASSAGIKGSWLPK